MTAKPLERAAHCLTGVTLMLCMTVSVSLSGAAIESAMPPKAQPQIPFTTVIAIQTRLDRLNLSCGCIDGKFGQKTKDAIAVWQKTAGIPRTNATLSTTIAKLGSEEGVFTEHVVCEDEVSALTPIPKTWAGKAAMPALGYETILEGLAERYHASEAAIRDLNTDVTWPNPPTGARLRVPNPFPAVKAYAARLQISLARKTIQALDTNGTVLAQFPCTIAAKAENRPVGELKIVNRVEHPNYTFVPELFAEDAEAQTMKSKLIIPPGPNNPVGTAWISLDRPGYGMHGTPRPEDIGKAASHGCFRLANWNAEKLIRMVDIGTPVRVEP